jgi:UDP-N-acetylglucosamine 4,6-dehydratase
MNVFEGKTVLVTGGTGSFGRYVVRRLLDEKARAVRIFSRDEKKQFDMMHKFSDDRLSFHIGDVRDYRSARDVVSGAEVVIHAAALKHVAQCERFPIEAVETNVRGADNVIRAAIDERVECLVGISTDKAVQPVNVMGMTKALQERVVVNANESLRNRGTRFVMVRYGNVLNSRGSVVPFFRSLLRRGLPLTITSTEMTRFLLTLKRAVDLVFYACREGKGGEIFVKRAPAANIMDIAAGVCAAAGEPFRHRVIGVFPGEKIHEVLVSEEERTRCEERADYFLIQPWRQTPAAQPERLSEYSSRESLLSADAVRALINEADSDAEQVEFEEGFFVR